MEALMTRSTVTGKLLKFLLEELGNIIGTNKDEQPENRLTKSQTGDVTGLKSIQDWCRGTIHVLDKEMKRKDKPQTEKDELKKCLDEVYSLFTRLDDSRRTLKSSMSLFVDKSAPQKQQLFVVQANKEAQENYISTFAKFMRAFLKSPDDFRSYSAVETNIFLAEYNCLLNIQALSAQYSLIVGKLFELHHQLQQDIESIQGFGLPKSIDRPQPFSLSSLLDCKNHLFEGRELNRLVKRKLEIPLKYKLDEADEDLKNFFGGVYPLVYDGTGFLARRWLKVSAVDLKVWVNGVQTNLVVHQKAYVILIDIVGFINIVARDRDVNEAARGLVFKNWVSNKENVLLPGIHCSIAQLAGDKASKTMAVSSSDQDLERTFSFRFEVETTDVPKIEPFMKIYEQAHKCQLWTKP